MNTSDTNHKNKKKLPLLDLEAYSPEEVTRRVMQVGVKKIRLPLTVTFMLGIIGGGFISLGVMYQQVVMANPSLNDNPAALISPIFYAMGYMIAFIAGAEVFTTNNLAVMSLAAKRISFWDLSRNWSVVFIANAIGAFSIAAMFILSGQVYAFDGVLAEKIIETSSHRLSFTPTQTFFQGLFGNLLICSGAWIAMAGRSVTDKLLALILPVSAVSALGFQHATGNMYQKFLAQMILPDMKAIGIGVDITLFDSLINFVLVALGNIVGGGILIALVYYFVYVRFKWWD